ncbi:hypothetical protein QOZ83_00005 [Romboutsia sedimentorum]|uniref:hypothetical protein n=1 Tax=Romboutsia sedimentorum TaxID=1368474 RepID=UPI0024DE0391|nr:hypothetical protein [Romboutsia sedimentorum]MDK2584227.1 hypothetical protein [Romboutsia sedimentorum]
MREISKIWNCDSKGTVKNKNLISGIVLQLDLSNTITATKDINFKNEVDVNSTIDKELELTIKEFILEDLEQFDFYNNFMPEKLNFNENDGYSLEVYIANNTKITVDLSNADIESIFDLPLYLEDEVSKLFECDEYDEKGIDNFKEIRQHELDAEMLENLLEDDYSNKFIQSTIEMVKKIRTNIPDSSDLDGEEIYECLLKAVELQKSFDYDSSLVEALCEHYNIHFEYAKEIYMLRKLLYPNYKYSQIFDDNTIEYLVNRTKIKNKIDSLKLNK